MDIWYGGMFQLIVLEYPEDVRVWHANCYLFCSKYFLALGLVDAPKAGCAVARSQLFHFAFLSNDPKLLSTI